MDYVEKIEEGDGNLRQFTTAYKDFGIHIQDDNSVVAKEWAPGAQEVFLTGEFSMCYFFKLIDIKCVSPYSANLQGHLGNVLRT